MTSFAGTGGYGPAPAMPRVGFFTLGSGPSAGGLLAFGSAAAADSTFLVTPAEDSVPSDLVATLFGLRAGAPDAGASGTASGHVFGGFDPGYLIAFRTDAVALSEPSGLRLLATGFGLMLVAIALLRRKRQAWLSGFARSM